MALYSRGVGRGGDLNRNGMRDPNFRVVVSGFAIVS